VQPPTDAVKDSLQHQQAPADASHKLAADASSGWNISGAIASGMSNAIGFLESSLPYLPHINLGSTEAAPAPKPETKPAAAPDKPAPDICAVPVGKKTSELESFDKTFASIKHSDKSFSLNDYLSSSGFDTGSTCKANAPLPSLSIGGMDFTVSPKATDSVNTGKVVTSGQTTMSKAQWQEVFDVINSETGKQDLNLSKWTNDGQTQAGAGDKAPVDKGRIEKTADGYVHHDAAGKVDFEHHGDLDIKHNADGTTSELDVKTGAKTLLDAQGHEMFRLGKDGFKGTAPDGTEIVISPDRQTALLTKFGVTTPVLIADGQFQSVINGVGVADRDQKALASLTNAFTSADHLFQRGQSQIVTFADAKLISDGHGRSMFVGDDGTSAISLDEHSRAVRSPLGDISVVYNDHRPTVHLSKQQVTALLAKHSEEAAVMAAVIKRLTDYGKTGELHDAQGGVLKHGPKGVSANVNNVLAETQLGHTVFTNKVTGDSELVNLAAKTVQLKAADGTPEATLTFDGKSTSVKTAQWEYKDGQVTTKDGTVYSKEGIKFHDGTTFKANGEITDNRGTTYNLHGEVIGSEHTAGSAGTDGAHKHNDEMEKAKVAQAESMVSSVLGLVSGGHVTAGSIAALQSSLSQLGSMIGALAQLSDPSILAAAVMAQGEVSSSLEIARDALNRQQQESNQAALTNATSNAITNAGGRTLALAGSHA
jgi:hypothetical protein